MSDTNKVRVLVLCTGNSCRSQMAEGFLNHLYGDYVYAVSAGNEPSGYVHDKAIQVMQEIGIDISGGESKHVDEFLDHSFEYVITVCDDANEICPTFPGLAERLHRNFTDPAKIGGSDEEQLIVFRRVRDELKGWLGDLFATDVV